MSRFAERWGAALLVPAAALWLAAGPARADKPAPLDAPPAEARPQPPGPPHGRAANSGGVCSAKDSLAIRGALLEAARRVRAAEAFLVAQPDAPHVRRFFGDTPEKPVLWTLERVALRLEHPDTVTLRCNDPQGCRGSIFAYSVRERAELGFCRRFFDGAADGQDSRYGTVVHEMSHLAAGTVDHAYQPAGAERLARDRPAQAAENADNYEYFVEFLPRSGPASGGPDERGGERIAK